LGCLFEERAQLRARDVSGNGGRRMRTLINQSIFILQDHRKKSRRALDESLDGRVVTVPSQLGKDVPLGRAPRGSRAFPAAGCSVAPAILSPVFFARPASGAAAGYSHAPYSFLVSCRV
jgi:hypothetical protein